MAGLFAQTMSLAELISNPRASVNTALCVASAYDAPADGAAEAAITVGLASMNSMTNCGLRTPW
ncbi:hypothetical protein Thimo_0456 [Thioflavicoccus mobilis 8321]|uniref:Uncharacterized protein n=1 Tax=Thioflavicoccus mobilis 8321 TaxID=765912 RepID=L0GVC2_9GAMM|nr:hypothetical protein Thimo_0456 [Thioflavicoccus mobilis 8321]